MQVKSAIYIGQRVEIHREEEQDCEVEMVINVSGKRKDNDFLSIRKQLIFIRFPFLFVIFQHSILSNLISLLFMKDLKLLKCTE